MGDGCFRMVVSKIEFVICFFAIKMEFLFVGICSLCRLILKFGNK